MKKKLNKFIRKIKANPVDGAILVLSLLIVIVGTLAIGFIQAVVIVVLVDLILLGIPFLYQKIFRKKKNHRVNQAPKTTYKSSKGKTILKWILIICFIFFIILFILGCIFVIYIIISAPKFNPQKLYSQQSSIIYDIDGKVITTLGVEKREKISYDEMPEVLVNAIIATEDSRFFQHNGFDLPRFTVATMKQLAGINGGGASTLTMQVSKNHFTSREAGGIKGIIRKFTDIYMSMFVIERKYTKEEILEFYVNSPFLGSNSYGVEQACQTYFGKSAKEINLAEAALIAGLFQAPGAYDPNIYPENAEERRQVVLYLMERHGYITKEEREIATSISVDKLLSKSAKSTNEFQGYIDAVIDDVIEVTGQSPYKVAMEIYTTMDREKQRHLNKIMTGKSYDWENKLVQSGISVIDNQTGAVLALGSGRKTGERIFNYATQSKRQIGSTSKPLYDYGPGIEYNNWSTYEPFVDEPFSYSTGGNLNNWDGSYYGYMSMREALSQSRNVPALKAFKRTDNKKIKEFVTNLGLHPEEQNGKIHEAHSVGAYTGESPLGLAAAYSAFANGGYYNKPHTFTKVVYREDNETFDYKIAKKRVMSAETAYMITDILIDASNFSVSPYSYINGITYAAKSGTTNFDDNTFELYDLPYGAVNDLWVVGYTPDYTISVWYGYEKINNKYVNYIGTIQQKKIFQLAAEGIFNGNKKFTKPSNVISVKLESEHATPVLASEYTPKSMIVTELFKKGTEPTEVSTVYRQLNDVSNLNSSIAESTLTLSWDAVADNPINKDTLINEYQKIFTNTSFLNSFVNKKLKYNKTLLGSIGYDIYVSENNELKHLGFTTKTKYRIDLTNQSGNITYVVKTTYSKNSTSDSDGSKITVDVGDHTIVPVTISLNGQSTINISIGDDYIESDPPVIILENSVNVTENATITTSIANSNGETINEIDTSIAGTYTIIYEIAYKDTTDTITRKVIVS